MFEQGAKKFKKRPAVGLKKVWRKVNQEVKQ